MIEETKKRKTFVEYLRSVSHIVAVLKAVIAGIEAFSKEYENYLRTQAEIENKQAEEKKTNSRSKSE